MGWSVIRGTEGIQGVAHNSAEVLSPAGCCGSKPPQWVGEGRNVVEVPRGSCPFLSLLRFPTLV